MSAAVRKAFTALGVFGHVARAVVFALVGYGLIKAAIDYDPSKAVGLDGALRQLAEPSYGPIAAGRRRRRPDRVRGRTRSPTPATGGSSTAARKYARSTVVAGIARMCGRRY